MINRNYDPKPRYFNINYEPIVGKNCSLVNTLFDCYDQITIGDNVAFGHDCIVLTAYHDSIYKGEERMSKIFSRPVHIEDGAWLATGVTVLPGVTIGRDAVIGAGSVVTKDVPPGQVWVGVPARFLRNI